MLLITENERLRLWDLTIAPGGRSKFIHSKPSIRWQVGTGHCVHSSRSEAQCWVSSGAASAKETQRLDNLSRHMRPVGATVTPKSLHARIIINLLNQVGDLQAENVLLSGASHHIADKQVSYYAGSSSSGRGSLWEVVNVGAENFRQVVVEFLEPAPRFTEEEVQEMFGRAIYSTAVGTELLFECDRCRVWDFSFPPGNVTLS